MFPAYITGIGVIVALIGFRVRKLWVCYTGQIICWIALVMALFQLQ